MDATATQLPIPHASAPEMEYMTLREEALRRMDQRNQILSITVTLAGAFLGIGWGTGPVAMLIYPPLAALLAAAWAQNEVRMRRLNAYIRDILEPAIPGLGYERFMRERDMATRWGAWPADVLAIGGIFLLTQLLAVGLALFKFQGQVVEWLLLALAVGSMALLLSIVEHVRRESLR